MVKNSLSLSNANMEPFAVCSETRSANMVLRETPDGEFVRWSNALARSKFRQRHQGCMNRCAQHIRPFDSAP